MAYDDPPDDEEWYDGVDDGLDEAESGLCPECSGVIHQFADKCPACGYWLSADDRRSLWSDAGRPQWLRTTAWVILAAFLVTLLVVGATLF